MNKITVLLLMPLIGMGQWKLAPEDDTTHWIPAVVPGTVFTSYVAAGLEKDPNFGDNIYQVDKSKYNRNFWYKTELEIPKQGNNFWLHFEGINRKGEVFFNGVRLGLLDGFMQRGAFNITKLIKAKNILMVLVHWPGLPVPNYASPTYISSDGWDWMPSVPGLLQGITDNVYVRTTGDVQLIDPWIRTDTNGSVSLTVDVKNSSDHERTATLKNQTITLKPGQTGTIHWDTLIENPRLWWPNGYGEPYLYTMDLALKVNGEISDSKSIRYGIRKYSYDTVDGVLHININGKRIFIKGGNWGMSEYLLRCRGAEYDLKLKLHQQMNLNMVRNWIGSVTDEEFYDACDKYGIMVWDDFWLNSHPNLPNDINAFNANAVEKIKRLRNHPSIAIWCGDNEGYPLPPLNGWLREDVKTFDGGDRWYHANSHSDGLTGSGPWVNFHPKWYFTKYPGGFGGDIGWGLRTEIGTAVFPNYESFNKFMPKDKQWPRNDMWDKHFFGKSAFNAGPDNYDATINNSYGKATGIEDYCRKAQLLNIETNKAMYEGWLHHMWDNASGIMTWMSQSAYPSMVWQTYDYYYDLTGAYWGVKKACEPVHIQWSYADNSVKVINTTLNNLNNVTAKATIYKIDGTMEARYNKQVLISANANSATPCFDINFSIDNLANKVPAVASSFSPEAGEAGNVADGSSGTRWSSKYTDDEWVYVDLGKVQTIAAVFLNWEAAYAKEYKLLVSMNATDWKEIYHNANGKGGAEQVSFTPVTARYVKMQGIKRALEYGYSLYDFEVYAKPGNEGMHFIQLQLLDNNKLLSDNFYWRSSTTTDYTALNTMPKASIKTVSTLKNNTITATITNSKKSIAFAIRVQAVNEITGEQLLPALMSDNYFTLLKGQSKTITITVDEKLLKNGKYKLLVEPYNK